jgi:hypothetical protein
MEFLHLSILRHNIAVEGSSTMMVDISAGIPASFLTTMMVDITAGISPSFLPHNDALCIRITNFWIAS